MSTDRRGCIIILYTQLNIKTVYEYNIYEPASPAKHNYNIIGLPHHSAPGGDRNFLTVVAMYNDNNILATNARTLL